MRIRRTLALGALVLVAGAIGTPATQTASGAPKAPENEILARELAIFRGEIRPSKRPPVSGGVMTAVIERFEPPRAGAASPQVAGPAALISEPPPAEAGTLGCPNVFEGGGVTPDNVRVNQDCSLRRQAEEVVVVNPMDPDNLIAGQNDSRIGFNHCGYDWTFDGGATWGDQVPPFWQFVQLDGHTSDACSDPTATFDSEGNAYVAGIIFDVVSAANSIVVAKSNDPIGGAFYHSPMESDFQEYSTAPLGVVASDDNPTIFHDKEFIVADDNAGSPKADNVYATWTIFSRVNSPIFFSQSEDGGATWSPAVEISGSNREICTAFSRSRNVCDQDQGSHPIVGPDGTIYVVFGNGNTPEPGINQVLFVKCPSTADCSNSASWTAPTRVGDLIGTHPVGDPGNEGGCPVGRQCLPPNGYRVPEFTSMSISVDDASNLYVVWSDFRNGDDEGSTCGPFGAWSEAEPPCDNDVFYAFSTDAGATWSETRNITPALDFGPTAQWQPWSEVTVDGDVLVAAYYDRSYVDVDDVDERTCEFTGCNDITAALIGDPTSATPTFDYVRITTDSMPNLVPANNPVQAGFLGDYMWVDTDEATTEPEAHIVWADTRPLFGEAPEEDIYYARIPVGVE